MARHIFTRMCILCIFLCNIYIFKIIFFKVSFYFIMLTFTDVFLHYIVK